MNVLEKMAEDLKQTNVINDANPSMPAIGQELPFGCIKVLALGCYYAKSVEDLFTWDDYVRALDGGTHEGKKIAFKGEFDVKPSKKMRGNSDNKKIYFKFRAVMPSVPEPIKRVSFIFADESNDVIPYLDAKRWTLEVKEIHLISPDESAKTLTRNIKVASFDGKPLQHDLTGLAKLLIGNEADPYDAYYEGKKIEIDGDEDDDDIATK